MLIRVDVDGVAPSRPVTTTGMSSELPGKQVQFDLPPESPELAHKHPNHAGSEHHQNRGHRPGSPDSDASDSTVDLPARFDQHGRRVPGRGEDPLADKIEDILSGRGKAGGLFKQIAASLIGDDRKRR